VAQSLVLIHGKSINVDACLAPGRSPEARQT
jgi:hypothetical protein